MENIVKKDLWMNTIRRGGYGENWILPPCEQGLERSIKEQSLEDQ